MAAFFAQLLSFLSQACYQTKTTNPTTTPTAWALLQLIHDIGPTSSIKARPLHTWGGSGAGLCLLRNLLSVHKYIYTHSLASVETTGLHSCLLWDRSVFRLEQLVLKHLSKR